MKARSKFRKYMWHRGTTSRFHAVLKIKAGGSRERWALCGKWRGMVFEAGLDEPPERACQACTRKLGYVKNGSYWE